MTLSSLLTEDGDAIMSMVEHVTGQLRKSFFVDPDERRRPAKKLTAMLVSLLEDDDSMMTSSSTREDILHIQRALLAEVDETINQEEAFFKTLDTLLGEENEAYVATIKQNLRHLHETVMKAHGDKTNSLSFALETTISVLRSRILNENENIDNTATTTTTKAGARDGLRGRQAVVNDEMMALETMITDLSKVLADESFLSQAVATLKSTAVHELGEDSGTSILLVIAAILFYAVGLLIVLIAVPIIIITFPISFPIIVLIVISLSLYYAYCAYEQPEDPKCAIFNGGNKDGNDESLLLQGLF
jgi:hypothetical protein